MLVLLSSVSALFCLFLLLTIEICYTFHHPSSKHHLRSKSNSVRSRSLLFTSGSPVSLYQLQSQQTNQPINLWKSAIGVDSDLNKAIEDAVDAIVIDDNTATLAVVFVSSIYEASAFSYNVIIDAIKTKLPHIKHVVGCTTGCLMIAYLLPTSLKYIHNLFHLFYIYHLHKDATASSISSYHFNQHHHLHHYLYLIIYVSVAI